MRHRILGKSGIEASVVGLGTWAIGGWMWGGTTEKESIRAIHAGLDAGINLIDTAPVYGFGVSEEIVGKAIAGRRDQVVVATKCGLVWHVEGGQHFFDSEPETIKQNAGYYHVYRYLNPKSIRYEVEQSLRHLRIETIDLYQTHWQDGTTPIPETMEELLKLKQEGKIRAIGCSNATPLQMDEYHAAGVLDTDQEQYSMLDRKHEQQNLTYCAKHEMAFLAYSPLALGLLTGKIGPERTFETSDQRHDNPRFSIENRRTVQAMLEAFRPIAEAHGANFAQLAIAWTISQPGCTHALVGARTIEQAQENAGAAEVQLSDDECNEMRRIIDEFPTKLQ